MLSLCETENLKYSRDHKAENRRTGENLAVADVYSTGAVFDASCGLGSRFFGPELTKDYLSSCVNRETSSNTSNHEAKL